jgi:signal transduction histidine kinase
MLSKTLIKGFNQRRLKYLLAFFFLALVIPTAALIWQAYSQLKWEAFHQYRGMAEELTNRIDLVLIDTVNNTEARSFADYTFLVVSGDPRANLVQRSPLSEFPVTQDLPGAVGYFQVGADGEFSTPLLPQGNADPATFGIGEDEFEQRQQVAQNIQDVLRDNQLVRYEPTGLRERIASSPEPPKTGLEEAGADKDAADRLPYAAAEVRASKPNESYSQAAFDYLNKPEKRPGGQNELGKVADLKLDAAYQKKSEASEKLQQEEQTGDDERVFVSGKTKRTEQISLPESQADTTLLSARHPAANLIGPGDLRISTFESEIDPLEFSLLDSGHFVLFRKVWREGERYIQGLLINQQAFVQGAFDKRFHETGLSAMSNLIVAYQDDVIHNLAGNRYSDYPGSSRTFDGALLYRNRLSAPLNSLELIYSINGLPPGPGASVLGWLTVILAIVFLGGFYTLYQLGLSQINLARQQQDFVSSVSHELKTPLTSIRMYGEILKEGWAEPEKQQQYYEFIHDESERLTRLISNVLQLARITRNEPQFDLKSVTAGELMDQIESKISSQVQRAGFELRFQKDELADEKSIKVDSDCFAQIIINLVDNGIKFSREAEQKRIEITSRLTSDNKVLFAVRDFGPGVPANQMGKIFKLFYRSESELTRETIGTGIGLAIVHQLSIAMDGKIDVINKEPGAEFRISFPIKN